MASEMKCFTSFEIKDAAKGEVEAVFATIGVTDHDQDVIRPGAIKHGAKVVVSSYGHDAVFGARPAGKGHIFIDGNKAGVRAKMFLNTTDGRDTFEVLKEMGADQEWSFGFVVLDEEAPTEAERKSGARRALTKLDSFEVSPVMRGAGIGTRTVAVKSAPQADGAGDDEVDPKLLEIATAAVKAHRAAEAAETKQREDADAAARAVAEQQATDEAARLSTEAAVEAERLTAITKAAELAEAQRVVREAETAAATTEAARADLARKAADEFERLQRNMRQHRVA